EPSSTRRPFVLHHGASPEIKKGLLGLSPKVIRKERNAMKQSLFVAAVKMPTIASGLPPRKPPLTILICLESSLEPHWIPK
ncbi:unnamed protein product, partial [Rhizoctonia solani]